MLYWDLYVSKEVTDEIFLYMSKVASLIRDSVQCIKYCFVSLFGLYSECLGNWVKQKWLSITWSVPSYITSNISSVKYISWKFYQRKIPDFDLLWIAASEHARLDLKSFFCIDFLKENLSPPVTSFKPAEQPIWIGTPVGKVLQVCP